MAKLSIGAWLVLAAQVGGQRVEVPQVAALAVSSEGTWYGQVMVLKNKLASGKEPARWMRPVDFVDGRTQGADWTWDEGLAAQLAVVEYRKTKAAERVRDAENKQALEAVYFVKQMGWLRFSQAYWSDAFSRWWYCADLDEEVRQARRV